MKNVLDIDQNGYVDFNEFSKRFGPTMSKSIHVEENQSGLAYNTPSKERYMEFSNRSKSVIGAINTVKKSFLPDPDASK